MKTDKNTLVIISNNCQFSIIHCQFRKWSAFPAQTPYHYAYNSPLTYRDPSGLAPEKEKEREELQSIEDWLSIIAGSLAVQRFIEEIQNSDIYNPGIAGNEKRTIFDGMRLGGVGSAGGIYIESSTETDENGQRISVQYYDGKLYNSDGTEYKGNDPFIRNRFEQLLSMRNSGNALINLVLLVLENSGNLHLVTQSQTIGEIGNLPSHQFILESSGSTTLVDLNTDLYQFVHEIGHAFLKEIGVTFDEFGDDIVKDLLNYELLPMQLENLMRDINGLIPRSQYCPGCTTIPNELLFPKGYKK